MKVILVNPPYSEFVYSKRKMGAAVDMPLGIAYIAAVLEEKGIEVSVIDANAENISVTETAKRIRHNSAEVVGITSTTTIMPLVYNLCDEIKKESDKIIVIGGPHVTFMDKRTLQECNSVDIVVLGEGEVTMLELVENKGNPENIRGITYRDKNTNEIITNPERERIKNLDEIPFPARHLFRVDLYRPGAILNIGVSGREYASLITARGCPNKCVYCSSAYFWGTKVRFRRPENVVSEIEFLVEKYGVKHIFFKDDTFTMPPKRTEKICDLIIERNLNVKWCCYARVNMITRGLLKKMKAAGCFGLDFGIESGSQEILNRIKKNITLDQSRETIRYAKEEKIMSYASFMIGLPGDDFETAKKTIDFAIEVSPDIAQFFIATPFPGTEFYEEALEKGWIDRLDTWKDLDISSTTKCRNDALSNAEIRRLISSAYKRFYMRPSFFWQSLKRIVRNPKELRQYAIGGLAVFNLAEV